MNHGLVLCCLAAAVSLVAAADAPRLRFGVLSDVHLYEPGDEDTFVKALEYFRDHGADGVLIAGDIAHTGGYGQLKRCADAWKKVFPGDKAPDGRHVEKLFIYGNHDIECLNWDKRPANDPEFEADSAIGKGQNRVRMWEKAFGEKYEPIWMKQVKGYTFIGAHWDKSDHTEIEAFMAAHGKEIDPKKPFFYTQHAHPKDTCFGAWAWGRDNGAAARAFAKFPNAVTFTGHSHYTLTDERTVWQGAFTSINTASLRYSSADYSLRENFGANHHGYRGEKRPHRMKHVDTGNGRQGMLVSVFDDRLVIERREFVYGQSLGDDWVVPMPAADGAYSYEKRAARRTAPEFAAGAKVAVRVTPKADEKDFTHVTLAFPAAEMRQKCRVFEYEVTALLCEDEVELIQAQRRMMSPDFHLPVSRLVKDVEFTFAAEDLPLKGHYRFEVRPVECFGKRGAAIVSDVVEVNAAAAVSPEAALWSRYAAATNATGCVLELAAGRYRLTKPMVFTRGITVRGAADGETVIDGGDALDRLVEIVHGGSDTFVFERLTFTHAAKQALAKGHVAYQGRGTLVVRDCRFIANGTKWNTGLGMAGRGLYTACANVAWGATTLVERCTFEGNAYRPAAKNDKGGGKGGAVVVSGQMRAQFTDCIFKGNGIVAPKDKEPCPQTLMSGAAAYVTGSPAEFVRCRFVGNCAVSQCEGGWMYDGATLALENSQKAVPWNCAVKDCVFEGNRVLAPGQWNRWSPTVGALFVSDSVVSGPVCVTGCTFAGNRADTVVGSAGISIFGGNLELRDSKFRDNAVSYDPVFAHYGGIGKGADLRLTGRFAGVPARPTRVTVANCAFESEGDDRIFASGGARLSLGKPDAPNGVLKVSDAALLARLPKLDLADVRKIVLDGKLATAGSEMPIRADGEMLVVQGEDGTVVDGLGKGTPLTVESTGSVSFVNLDLAGLGSVWPVRLGAGLTQFERCRSDGAPGVEIVRAAPACVEPKRSIGWPTICRRKSGELIAVFSGDRTAHVSKDGKVQAVRSTDGGVTWSAPETWVNSVVDDRDSGLVELPNGDLALFYFSSVCYAGTGYTNDFVNRIGCDYKTAKAAVGAFCRRSADGGRTWGEPSRLRGIAPHGACVTKDGRLVLVSRGQRAEGNVLENDPAWATTTHKLYAEASADGGRSWTLLHEFEVPKGVDVTKIHEPHVVEAADGSLVAQFRTSLFEGVLLQSVSADGGRSWTPLAPTALHGHPAHLIRLADGRLLTTYGRRSGENGGSGVYVAVSSDNGRTWGRELKVSCNAYNVYNFGYPATADLGDGKFLTVCYQQVADNATPCLMAVRWSLGK